MLVIREATLDDVKALQELYLKHLTQTPPQNPLDISKWTELLDKLIADPDYYLLVGELDSKVVASVTLIVIRNLTHNLRPYALIENVVTHCDYRNKGLASALMNKASEIAQNNHCYKIMLMTGSKQESTLRFYESCGFNRYEKTAFLKKLP
jgi:ribosomal protein S18 acetylase RimI-like enzyme